MKKLVLSFILIAALLLFSLSWAGDTKTAPPIATGQVYCVGPTLAQGTTPAYVASAASTYWIGNVLYSVGASAGGTAPNADVIPQNKYGAWAFDVNATGTISATSATLNTTGYSSAALALAGIPGVVATKARLGTVTVIDTGTTFTGGSTSLTAANVTATYASTVPIIYLPSQELNSLPYTLLLVPITASTTIWISPLSTLTTSTGGTPLSTTGIMGVAINAHPGETWRCLSATAATIGFTAH